MDKDTVSLTSHPRMLMVMLVGADSTPAMTGSYFVQMLESWNLDEDAMVVREGKQNIPLSSNEYSNSVRCSFRNIKWPDVTDDSGKYRSTGPRKEELRGDCHEGQPTRREPGPGERSE